MVARLNALKGARNLAFFKRMISVIWPRGKKAMLGMNCYSPPQPRRETGRVHAWRGVGVKACDPSASSKCLCKKRTASQGIFFLSLFAPPKSYQERNNTKPDEAKISGMKEKERGEKNNSRVTTLEDWEESKTIH